MKKFQLLGGLKVVNAWYFSFRPEIKITDRILRANVTQNQA